ncbi:MAG TPA: class I SAM-dependent methyltransferase [Bacteroidia bacterium]
MEYDPVKRSLGNVFNKSPFLRKLFYNLLDLLLLRAWHVHKELGVWCNEFGDKDKNILDAGAGFGQYSFWLAKRFKNARITSVDVKDEQVTDCNNFFQQVGLTNAKFEVADLTNFSHPDKYDLAISIDVMEHILEDVQVFKNIYASLKKGGMLLISTPSDQGGSDVHEGHEGSFIGEHVRDGYNINDIQDKLKLAGFSKIDVRYSYGTPGKISWKLSMKYPMQMLSASKLFFVLIPFYYLITYPLAFVLNYFDTYSTHKTGTGLIVKAWK